MYKNLGINAAFTTAVASATVARIKFSDEKGLQVLFTNRTNTSNLPKGENLVDIKVKGNGRRIGLKSEIADRLPAVGTGVKLVAGKYNWFTIVAADDGDKIDGRVSA
jgi:hypothetical protein